MLDTFEVVTFSGIVLFSKKYASIPPGLINGFIRDVFIEETADSQPYQKEKYALRWRTSKDLELIFILSWIEELLDSVKTLFVALYGDALRKPNRGAIDCPFDNYFEQRVRELEKGSTPRIVREDTSTAPRHIPADIGSGDDDEASDAGAPKAVEASSDGLLKPGPRLSRRAKKAASTSSIASSGDEGKATPKKKGAKKMRKWDAEGMVDDDDDEKVLDYSKASENDLSDANFDSGAVTPIKDSEWGSRTSKGEFVLKDLDDEINSILAADTKSAPEKSGVLGSSIGAISGLFRNVVGGKTLSKADLEGPLKGMEDHLLKKNVAREAAVRLCESVEQSLLGVKTASFQSIDSALRSGMEEALRKMLTPTSSLDLLRAINAVTNPSMTSLNKKRAYVISIVGVNGVGKSTNLSKIGFFLLQNKYRLLIAACDTFRAGAVEQLRVHAVNLAELSKREGGYVELYQKGYGKDAANIAKDAVSYANANDFDVVLIDTAGRRHNDQRLMSSLEKFANFAKPDKILMVGEALVGSDSVQQARNFNAAFGAGRKLDGFIISKCDTVGDMVGTLVSMVHATGIPVVFLGVGQHYGDLRTLNITWAVKLLMS